MKQLNTPSRRGFLSLLTTAATLAGMAWLLPGRAGAADKAAPFHLTDAQWRQRLTPEQYAILRRQGTEAPFTSPLLHEKRPGVFGCAGCGNALFQSSTKFDSGTGWPSFWQPIGPSAVATESDNSLLMARTEVHCANCAGHLGHVFDDGPKPTGLRYCMNGAVLTFKAAA